MRRAVVLRRVVCYGRGDDGCRRDVAFNRSGGDRVVARFAAYGSVRSAECRRIDGNVRSDACACPCSAGQGQLEGLGAYACDHFDRCGGQSSQRRRVVKYLCEAARVKRYLFFGDVCLYAGRLRKRVVARFCATNQKGCKVYLYIVSHIRTVKGGRSVRQGYNIAVHSADKRERTVVRSGIIAVIYLVIYDTVHRKRFFADGQRYFSGGYRRATAALDSTPVFVCSGVERSGSSVRILCC